MTEDEMKALLIERTTTVSKQGYKLEQLEKQLAESQARERVLRDALLEETNYQMRNYSEVAICIEESLSQPTDDSTLNMMLAKEFSKGYRRGIGNYEDSLKSALGAERERCIEVIQGIANCVEYDGDTADECINAIRALEE